MEPSWNGATTVLSNGHNLSTKTIVMPLHLGSGGRGGGGGGVVTLGVIVVRVFEPALRNRPQSYTWPLKKRTHSYTRSSKMLIHSYTVLWFLYPFIAGRWTNIAVYSLNTKRTSKNLWKKNMCMHRDASENWTFHILIQKNGANHILFCWKKGPIIYLAALKRGAIRHAHLYYAIYRKLPPHPEHYIAKYSKSASPEPRAHRGEGCGDGIVGGA